MNNNEQRMCPHNCHKCSIYQQILCASQSSLNIWDMVITLNEKFDAFMAEIKGQALISPSTQKRAAAQRIDSQDKTIKDEQL